MLAKAPTSINKTNTLQKERTKYHQPVVGLASNDTSNTLRSLSKSIKVQKVLLSDLVVSLKIFQPCPQDM